MSSETQPPAEKRSLVQRGLDFIFGYDFFISYTRRDGGKDYAEGLARRLKAAGFQIFFDSDEYAMGDDWKVEGKWALKRTSQLVLVASPEALSSPAVVREVELYSSLPKRRIIPIDFDGTIRNRDESKPIFKYLKSEILFIEEDPSCLGSDPSDFIVQKLQDGFNLKRQDTKRSRVFTVVAALLAMLAVAAVAFGFYAREQSIRAVTERDGAWTLQSLFLADTSEEQLTNGDAVTAALLALEGLQDPNATDEPHRIRPDVHGAYVSLESAWRGRREQAVLAGHEGWVFSAAFSPDGTRIVTASEDKTARVWDALTGETLNVLQGHAAEVYSAAFGPKGERIVTASGDKTVRVWAADGSGEPLILEGHAGIVRGATFSPDGARIVTASDDKTARVWDALTGDVVKVLEDHTDSGHTDPLKSARFSPDGAHVVTASDDWYANIWEVATGKLIGALEGHQETLEDAAFSPDGKLIVTTSADKTARIWDASTRKQIKVLEGHGDIVWSAAFSPDGTRILSASQDGTARFWDAESGKEIQTLTGHEKAVNGASFSTDGTRIVTASNDETARVWVAAPGEVIQTLRGHKNTVYTAAFSPDGALILTASKDGTARFWDAETGRGIPPHLAHSNAVNGASFSPGVDEDIAGAVVVEIAVGDREQEREDPADGAQDADSREEHHMKWASVRLSLRRCGRQNSSHSAEADKGQGHDAGDDEGDAGAAQAWRDLVFFDLLADAGHEHDGEQPARRRCRDRTRRTARSCSPAG